MTTSSITASTSRRRNRRTAAQQPQPSAAGASLNLNSTMPHSTVQNPSVVAGLRRLLSTEEASIYLGCHLRTVFRLIDEGRLKAYRLGRSLKFRPEDLDRALEPVNAGSAATSSLEDFVDQQFKTRAS